jgi:hypothetical protein
VISVITPRVPSSRSISVRSYHHTFGGPTPVRLFHRSARTSGRAHNPVTPYLTPGLLPAHSATLPPAGEGQRRGIGWVKAPGLDRLLEVFGDDPGFDHRQKILYRSLYPVQPQQDQHQSP